MIYSNLHVNTTISSACQGQQDHDQEFRIRSSHGYLGSKIVQCVYGKNILQLCKKIM